MLSEPICHERRCKHYAGVQNILPEHEETAVHCCTAYPKGIPDRITYGDDRHMQVEHDQVGDDIYEEKPRG